MNELIRELAQQAGYEKDMFGIGHWDMPECKKFAELIVRKCADICVNENVSNLDLKVIHESGKFTVQDLATKSCGENLAKRIKEHFGVKE